MCTMYGTKRTSYLLYFIKYRKLILTPVKDPFFDSSPILTYNTVSNVLGMKKWFKR